MASQESSEDSDSRVDVHQQEVRVEIDCGNVNQVWSLAFFVDGVHGKHIVG